VVDATGAGLIVIVITAAVTTLGWRLGHLIGARWPGALLGLSAVRWRYRSL
jgi:hypothetical protein